MSQKKILEQLKAGEISLEEAERLLGTLDEETPQQAHVPPSPPPPPRPPKSRRRQRRRKIQEGWAIRTSELVSSLEELGYTAVTDGDLHECRIHRITPAYIQEMAQADLRIDSIDDLVALRIHNVKPRYVEALLELDLDLDVNDIVELSIHNIRPSYIEALIDAGVEDLDVEAIQQLGIHNVRPQLLEALSEYGFEHLSVDDIVQLGIHNVHPRLLAALSEHGFENLNVDEMVQLGVHNIRPSFINDIAELDLEDLGIDLLVQMAIHGIRPQSVARMRAKGLSEREIEQMIREPHLGHYQMRTSGGRHRRMVRRLSRRILRMREGGNDPMVIAFLQKAGVDHFTPAFREEMQALGYENVSMAQLVDMWALEIDLDDVQGGVPLPDLIARRIDEVRADG